MIALAIANAVLGMALGLFLSAFATSEFQAVQFMPAFVLPQLLLVGLFVPRQRLPDSLDAIASVLPFTYAYEALAHVSADDIRERAWRAPARRRGARPLRAVDTRGASSLDAMARRADGPAGKRW